MSRLFITRGHVVHIVALHLGSIMKGGFHEEIISIAIYLGKSTNTLNATHTVHCTLEKTTLASQKLGLVPMISVARTKKR